MPACLRRSATLPQQAVPRHGPGSQLCGKNILCRADALPVLGNDEHRNFRKLDLFVVGRDPGRAQFRRHGASRDQQGRQEKSCPVMQQPVHRHEIPPELAQGNADLLPNRHSGEHRNPGEPSHWTTAFTPVRAPASVFPSILQARPLRRMSSGQSQPVLPAVIPQLEIPAPETASEILHLRLEKVGAGGTARWRGSDDCCGAIRP
jgi:hypothetical protein